jgi:hypothetical protein
MIFPTSSLREDENRTMTIHEISILHHVLVPENQIFNAAVVFTVGLRDHFFEEE